MDDWVYDVVDVVGNLKWLMYMFITYGAVSTWWCLRRDNETINAGAGFGMGLLVSGLLLLVVLAGFPPEVMP